MKYGPDVRKGDVFVVARDSALFRMIRRAEIFLSTDGAATYGHAGIITSDSLDTFEQLKTARYGRLDKYEGMPIFIVRPVHTLEGNLVTAQEKDSAIEQVIHNFQGNVYPAWRFFWHFFKPLAKYATTGRHVVCSEMVARYLMYFNAFHGSYKGINPDDLADRFVTDKYYKKIFEGEWGNFNQVVDEVTYGRPT